MTRKAGCFFARISYNMNQGTSFYADILSVCLRAAGNRHEKDVFYYRVRGIDGRGGVVHVRMRAERDRLEQVLPVVMKYGAVPI